MVSTELTCVESNEKSKPKEIEKKYFVGLWLTDGCNLKCTYCFQDRYKRPIHTMTKEVLDQTIKYINKIKPTGLAFFGGEPLLAKNGIKRILAQTDVPRYYITTNGTLLDDDIFDWFEHHKVFLNLSLDGAKDTQDTWRDNSYDRIMKNLPRILHHIKHVGGNVLCTNVMESQLYRNVKHIKSLGFPTVFINQLDGYAGQVRNEPEKIDIFRQQYELVLTLHSDDFKIADYQRWKSVLSGNLKPGHCGYGNRGLGISPTGLLYGCHRGPELPESLSFGNVFDGIDQERETHIRGMAVLPPKCEACDLHLNQCPVSCYQKHKKFGVNPHDTHCLYERAKADIVMAHASLEEMTIPKSQHDQATRNVRLIVGTMIDPHKYYVLPIFLKHLMKMQFPPITDYYFILDEDDFTTHKLLRNWKEGFLSDMAPYREDIVRSFKTIKVPIHSDDKGIDRITRGRDLMLNIALKGHYTHLFFLDSDIISPPSTVHDLLSINSPIAGGLVKTRNDGRSHQWYNTYMDKRAEGKGFPSKTDFVKGDIIDVDATGCDCVLIRSDVLEAVGYYEWQSDPPLGEDMWFCLKAKKKGFGVKIHTGIVTRHLGVGDMALKEIKGQDAIPKQ